ncbi:hypothetical protein Xen7305DRAFT_00008630 [Xenococcus sp. PCC 7305]|uniref:hypothetical protein n=1 Tax=Xenococcus sp. PCC 7305 TaxID=102125 RepID=UPI0002AC8AD7|nr:hypothetical protein [Xenococcus sp. PCC 7305]ELS01161.1 hypothetical protein Xen7305DRAFT_00008630 [Xenococcus sp. PCC 7305]
MNIRFCPSCGKKIAPAVNSTQRQACASCGWTGEILYEKAIPAQQKQLKPRITAPKKELTTGSIEGAILGLVILPVAGVILGLFILIIPIIGWILSPLILLVSVLGFPMMGLRELSIASGVSKPEPSDYTLKGKCPYCDHDLSVGLEKNKITCDFCKETVSVKNERFYTIVRRHYA